MKKLWKQNRVIFMLIIILIICFVAICIVALTFFYSKNVSIYGSRLDGIEKYELDDTFKEEYKDSILKNENVKKVTLELKGRIIYIHIDFNETIKLEDAKKIAEASLSSFGEEKLSYYDIDFVLKSDNFVIFGAKNAITENTSWNNNKKIVEEEEKDEK